MSNSSTPLPPPASVSQDSGAEWALHGEKLLAQVNQRMAARPEIHGLIGGNPLEMMFDNHANHLRFMTAVFRMGSHEMLATTIPWVYRAYHGQGFNWGYFPVELAEWRTAASDLLTERAFEEIGPVYDWMIAFHSSAVAEAEAYADVDHLQGEHRAICQRLLENLLRGDAQSAIRLALERVQSGKDLPSFYTEIIQPVMYQIGALWERGAVSVADEHLASSIVARLLAQVYGLGAMGDGRRGVAVVSSAPNEYHEVGGRMVADLLESDGWDVRYLGANLPDTALIDAIRIAQPRFVALSAAMPFNVDQVQKAIAALRADAELAHTRVMVGGQAFNAIPELWRSVGADGYAKNAADAVLLANEFSAMSP